MMRKDFDPGPPLPITTDTSGPRPTLIFVRDLRHSPATVWEALTDPKQLAEWAPFTPDRNMATPGPLTLKMTDQGKTEEFKAQIRKAVYPSVLEYSWGEDLLVWKLDTDGKGGTRLTLRHTVESKDWLPKVTAGWHICLAVAERLLDGTPVGPITGTNARNYGWDELNNAYAAALGITNTGFPEEEFKALE